MATAKPPHCNSAAPSPRIFIYENLHRVPGGAPSETGVPRNLLPPPNLWRNSRHVTDWVRASAHNELDGDCADFFLLPGYPPNRFGEGDLGIARLFDHLRRTWPHWNRTVAAGTARHLWMLPCDHGPGDCGYDRPLLPNKYTTERPRCSAGPSQRCSTSARAEIERLWGGGRWEQLNPASPERLVISLQFNGWADYYRGQNGHCVSCFAHGLDVRLPTPESHLCGPLCGLHRRANATVTARQLLRTLAYWGENYPLPSIAADAARAPAAGGCRLQWYGAVRRRNNGDRSALLGLNGTAGWCVVNTEDAGRQLRLPEAMRRSEFCYSPRGWDQGDSDRYLPAVLHGCVPVMADRFEAMPLAELPEMGWDAAALAVERDDLPRLPALLDALPPARTREMRAAAAALWPRLLYTTLEFSTLEEIKRERDSCPTCSPHAVVCKPNEKRLSRKPTRCPRGEIGSRSRQCEACGPPSYLGEDGARDALAGLMSVLRLRLGRAPAPLEPWARPALPPCVNATAASPARRDGCVARVRNAILRDRASVEWCRRRNQWATSRLRAHRLDANQSAIGFLRAPTLESARRTAEGIVGR